MQIVSLLTGRIAEHQSPEGVWQTATFKQPVAGPLRLSELGLEGDEQADRVNHGGPDKAVLVYAAAHYPGWQSELALPGFGPGALGENFCVQPAAESTVCLGDRYRIGQALVEVSQPRQPCWKQARRWAVKDLVVRIVRSGRTGWYLRVLKSGSVQAGDALLLESRPHPDWPVARANDIFHHQRQNREQIMALLAVPVLSASWKATLTRRLKELG